MHFEPATEQTAPPARGPNSEALTRDCKGHVDINDLEELGKDVAALANAVGGVIWVGVQEDKSTNIVSGYNPKSAVDAEKIRTAYQTAAADHCSPSPLVNTVMVRNPEPNGGFLVAVNVWPFPGQVIGVRDEKDQFKYRFPIRLGNQTTFLRAEQLPMLMIPELRRVSILLHQMAVGDAVHVVQEDGNGWDNATFAELRELENVVSFIVGDSENKKITLPLDHVESVWRDPEKWRVKVRGRWEPTHLGGTRPRR